MKPRIAIWALTVWAAGAISCISAGREAQSDPIPVIYSTDLYHPHNDPDDHFDLAALYAMPELDVKGIVLDQGRDQLKAPGAIPVSQMNRIKGRTIPAVLGLGRKLSHPGDTAFDEDPRFQEGIRFILSTLRKSPVPVTIVAVGSVRDVTAAYNREPELFRAKVAKVFAFIGEGSHPDFQEYNVALDPQAYVGLMRSGLPIYWIPCFDGGEWQNRGHASFWKAKHEDLLKAVSPPMIQFFSYMLEKDASDPLAFISSPVDPERKKRLFAQTRNLWCTAVFRAISGQTVAFDGTRSRFVPMKNSEGQSAGLFDFVEAEITVSDKGVVRAEKGGDSRRVMLFKVCDASRYAAGMTAATADLLSQ